MKKQTLKFINLLLAVVLILGVLMTAIYAVDLTKTTGSLTITKYETGLDDDGNSYKKELAGVTFDIYKVDDDETSTATPTDETILATKQSATTDSTGIVTFSNLALGRYLAVESNAPENVVEKIANFLVDIPMTDSDGKTLIYDVEVFPKNNTVYGGFVLNKQDSEGNALEGVTFELQKETSTDTWTKYNTETLATDENGNITLTGLPAGNYRFVELSTLTGYILDNNTTYDFTVSMDTDGSTKVEPDTVTIVNEKPTISKKITSTTTSGSVKIGDSVTYEITADVPSTIANLTTYSITDTLDAGLTYNSDSLAIKGGEVTLTKDEDYSVSVNGQVVTITFTNANLADYDTVTLTYNATVNSNADATATGNTNKAELTYSTVVKQNYNNESNTETIAVTDKTVNVYTGGFYIKKVDKNSNVITTGATFKIAATEAEAKAGTYLKDENGDEITLTTGDDGYVSYKGLTYGTYWLVETQAPTYADNGTTKSYNLLTSPVEITVDVDSFSADNAIDVVNKTGFQLPATGGVGTILIIAVGAVLIVSGFVIYRKGKNNEQ